MQYRTRILYLGTKIQIIYRNRNSKQKKDDPNQTELFPNLCNTIQNLRVNYLMCKIKIQKDTTTCHRTIRSPFYHSFVKVYMPDCFSF